MTIALTVGEPAGIGPDITIAAAQQQWSRKIVAIADADLLKHRAEQLRLPLDIIDYSNSERLTSWQPGQLMVYHVPLAKPSIAGVVDAMNGGYVIDCLIVAAQGCLNQQFSALVTGPVDKAVINQAGIPFSGHTEFFAQLADNADVVMLLAVDKLRVALVTTHLPLQEVSAAITPERLKITLKVLYNGLRTTFKCVDPAIYIAGLNPHAGEQGYLGREEIEVISPTIEELKRQGMNLIGPQPADTMFNPRNLAKADAFLAMYHDQGLPVLKYAGFNRAINITLGLPFIRTSVDHGTAIELAGTGKANPGSLFAALRQAIDMV